MDNAIGIIETKGLTAAIAATDAMVKAANVEIVRTEQIGSALVTVLLRGDVASVRAALDAGAEAGRHHGEIIGVHVIASPHRATAQVYGLLGPAETTDR